MNIDRTRIKSFGALFTVLACLTLFTAGSALGATQNYYLKAVPFTIAANTFNNPAAITMWGYASCTDNTFGTGVGQSCTPPTVPGPALTATAGDTVNIHLQNGLPVAVPNTIYSEPTSVIIPGQSTTMTPTWTDNTTGNRGASLSKRIRSFTAETAVGGTTTYTWTGVKAGTYLYQSGTHPAVQVQMGLYGTLKVLSAAGRAYSDPSSAFDSEVTLLFSEIDPVLHASIAAGHYGPNPPTPAPADWLTSTIDYHPKYFLINGQAYSSGNTPLAAGAAEGRLLLRFLNAGLQSKVPVVQGPYMSVIAEDGNFMTVTDTAGDTVAAPKQQYSVFLPAGKTMDAILTPTATGYIPVYDRRLNLSNGGVSPGGMLAYLQVGTANRTLTVTKDGTGSGTVTAVSSPGGISCGSVCTDTYLDGTNVVLHADPAAGNIFTPWNTTTASGTSGTCDQVLANGDCLVTMNGNKTVNANFRLVTKVTVLTPNGGEIIPTGSSYLITWEAPAAAVKFNLQYSINNGTSWITIASGVTGNSYNWTVPAQTANRPLSRVRVIGLNAAGVALPAAVGTDISNAPFTIEVVRLTAPNGGEIIPPGSTFNITWTTNATVSPVTSTVLQYSINNGASWLPIVTLAGNPGTYIWTVPAQTANHPLSRVRVNLMNGATNIGTDMSDAPFNIELVRLTAPNGGEVIPSGSTYNITWTNNATIKPVTSVVLQYSINGGATWITITTITGSNPGTYSWTVPAVSSTNSKVQVILRNGATNIGTDMSDAPFTIEVVRLTAPNGGEAWTSGSVHNITWTTNATAKAITSVLLSFSINNGVSWLTITTLPGNPGTYAWTVPNETLARPTSKVRVTLRNGATNIVTDMSDAVFTISPP